eukprot:scaffold31931_cov33-Prasinocladus_malaysianus.AAC.1
MYLGPLCGHLFLEGCLDACLGQDVPHLHPGDLDPPGLGGLVQLHQQLLVELRPGAEGGVQGEPADLCPQLGEHQVLDGAQQAVHSVPGQPAVKDAEVDHRVRRDGGDVSGDAPGEAQLRQLQVEAVPISHGKMK